MNSTDLIHLIKHFMRNEHKAVEEVIDSPPFGGRKFN